MLNEKPEGQPLQVENLAHQLSRMLYPDAILPAIFEAVGYGLGLPYVAVHIDRSDTAEPDLVVDFVVGRNEQIVWHEEGARQAMGDEPTTTPPNRLSFPFMVGSTLVGRLVVDTQDPQHALDAPAQQALALLASRAGEAVRVVRMTYDLRRARERLVLAREEERRRLRRDLHDSIGPTLAALSLRSGSIRKLIVSKPDVAETQMGELREQIRQVITDIRRVVYNLRPPALDELGMLPAMRELARQFSQDGLSVTVDAPERLPALSAAVEVAAYQIFSEALTNVFRHAAAHNCWVRLDVREQGGAGVLSIEIEDDGKGIPQDRRAGVGLMSFQERTAELGGVCGIMPNPSGGTIIRAVLPLGSLAGYAADLASIQQRANSREAHIL